MKPLHKTVTDPAPRTWQKFQEWYDTQDEYTNIYEDFLDMPFDFQAGVFISFFHSQSCFIFIECSAASKDWCFNSRIVIKDRAEITGDGYYTSFISALENAVRKSFDELEEKSSF